MNRKYIIIVLSAFVLTSLWTQHASANGTEMYMGSMQMQNMAHANASADCDEDCAQPHCGLCFEKGQTVRHDAVFLSQIQNAKKNVRTPRNKQSETKDTGITESSSKNPNRHYYRRYHSSLSSVQKRV